MDFLSSDGGSALAAALLIFAARTVDVALGTVRIALVARGNKRIAPLIGFFEILVWLLALGQVFRNLDQPLHYVAYAAGFAHGTWAGLWLEEKLAMGLYAVRIITPQDATQLTEELGGGRFGVTSFAARGLKGRVRLLFTVIHRRDLSRLMERVRAIEPKAFVSVSDVRMAAEGHLPRAGTGRWRLGLLGRK